LEWLQAHRVLLAVYALALALAWAERTQPGVRPGEADDPSWFLEPGSNIADVSSALYPERAASLYYRAFQAALCTATPPTEPNACRDRGPVAPGEVRELLERALATGNESIELALYNYVLVLLQEGATDTEVDAAVRRWRVAYPTSGRKDPRTVASEMQRERQAARPTASAR
jgi:hypothetical protein